MRKKALGWLQGILVLGLIVSLCPLLARAQDDKPRHGRIEVGVRQMTGKLNSSKFLEYRDISDGFFVERFELTLDDLGQERWFLNLQARETVEKDQSYLFGFGRYGTFDLQLRGDQTPHDFTDAARSFFFGSSAGGYAVSPFIRASLSTNPSTLPLLLEGAPPIGVFLRRNNAGGLFTFTPSANWTLKFDYGTENQLGVRPFGTTTNSFTNMLEFPEPIDYRTNLVKANAEYANRKWGIQVGYSGSFFRNDISELIWENPFRLTDAVNGAARGRLDLYPDNSAHNLSFAGAVNLGASTRFMASIVPGWMRQNDPFLPFTINTALTGVPSLPANSLTGEKQTLAMNYTLTNHYFPAWSFTARYRSYDYNNHTPSFIFDGYVRTDASLVTTARRNLPYAYHRQTLGVDASWEFRKGSFVKFLYDWEGFSRDYRDVEKSSEHTAGVSWDFNPQKWFLLRTSYKHSERDPKHYEPNEESFPFGEGVGVLGQLHELRKFDEAARSRDRLDALLQLTFTDTVAASAFFGTSQDDYKDSLYGLLKDINYNFGFDFTYSPRPEISLFAEYTREKYKYSQRSRQRTPTNDSTNNDWFSDMRDRIDTWAVGVDGSVFDNRIVLESFYSLSAAKGSIRTLALGSSALPGFLVTTAQDYPDTSNRFHQLVSSVKVRLPKHFWPKFEYRFEKYGRVDFQTDRLDPYMVPLDPSTNTSIFLGADVPGYKVHIFAFTLEYLF